MFQAGRTLGAAKQELVRRHGCDPREVDITVLLGTLVQADFVSEIDGYPISAGVPPFRGPLWTLVGTFIRLPLAQFLVRHAPLWAATLLFRVRLAPRLACLLRRIRGNMRSAPALPGAAGALDRLARENYDGMARMYLERLFLSELPGGALGVRALARSAIRGETAILLCDTGVGAADEGVEVPFLGRRLRATAGTAWRARRTGAPVLPVVITRQPDGTHHLRIISASSRKCALHHRMTTPAMSQTSRPPSTRFSSARSCAHRGNGTNGKIFTR